MMSSMHWGGGAGEGTIRVVCIGSQPTESAKYTFAVIVTGCIRVSNI